MRAPSPALICVATKDDYFDIDGAWEAFRYAKRLYSDLGFPERIDIVESNPRTAITSPTAKARHGGCRDGCRQGSSNRRAEDFVSFREGLLLRSRWEGAVAPRRAVRL